MPIIIRPSNTAVIFVTLVTATCVSQAATWRITPSLSLMALYDSNVTLGSGVEGAPGTRQAADSFITVIAPTITVQRNGVWKLNLTYSMQNLFYTGTYSATRTNNYLQMLTQGPLVKDSVYLLASSTISYYNNFNTLSGAFGTGRYQVDNISRTGNTTEYRTLTISPYWVPHFGGYVDGMVRVNYTNVSTGNNGQNDSNMLGEFVNLNSGREIGLFGWYANFFNQDVFYDRSNLLTGASDINYRGYGGQLSYTASEKLQPFVQGWCYENNFKVQVRGVKSGCIWNGGLIWAPSPKTVLQGGYGPNNYFASLTWNPSRRTNLMVAYRHSSVGGAYFGGYGAGYGGAYGIPGGYGGGYGLGAVAMLEGVAGLGSRGGILRRLWGRWRLWGNGRVRRLWGVLGDWEPLVVWVDWVADWEVWGYHMAA
ncbi:protein of unknown function [Candidatus Methylocalor cossyra]|uniref:Uncharacterized protein n=2 Tax=Candidatus Methylocalor cossyra TaxID=3108543 RepID=A0ABM9NG86_9GAMM